MKKNVKYLIFNVIYALLFIIPFITNAVFIDSHTGCDNVIILSMIECTKYLSITFLIFNGVCFLYNSLCGFNIIFKDKDCFLNKWLCLILFIIDIIFFIILIFVYFPNIVIKSM